MKRELNKDQLAKLYKEYSRQKYNKYKHQFPRMRESELVSKIIKQWQSLENSEKLSLYQTISENKDLDDKSQSSQKKESPGSSKEKKKKSQSKVKGKVSTTQTPSKKNPIRVFHQSSSSKKDKAQSQSDFARQGVKKDFEISESNSKQLGKKTGGKTKKITKQLKQPRTEYLKFFKFYYDKLTLEHPRWSANQISTIIKLLWKKKLSQDRQTAKSSTRVPRQKKPISGRLAFRKNYGYDGHEGRARWIQLPKESKVYWNEIGQGLKSGDKKVISNYAAGNQRTRRSPRKSSSQTNQQLLSFINKSIN